MTPAREHDIKVAAVNVSRSIAEVIYCSIQPQITGPHRIDEAHRTFGESIVNLVRTLSSGR